MPGVTDCTRVYHGAPASVHNPTYAIPRAQPAHHFVRAWGNRIRHVVCRSVRLAPARKGRRPRHPAVAEPPGWVRRTRSAWPTAPTFPTVCPPSSTTPRMQFRGRSPRTISYGRTGVVLHPRPGGRGSPPLQCEWGMFRRGTGVIRRPKAGRRGRRPLRAVCILRVAACNVRAPPAHLFLRASEVVLHPKLGGRGSPPLRHVSRCQRATCVTRPPAHRTRKKDRSADRSFLR